MPQVLRLLSIESRLALKKTQNKTKQQQQQQQKQTYIYILIKRNAIRQNILKTSDCIQVFPYHWEKQFLTFNKKKPERF